MGFYGDPREHRFFTLSGESGWAHRLILGLGIEQYRIVVKEQD
jgi:hypothetical protein